MFDPTISVPFLHELIVHNLQDELPCDPSEARALEDGWALDIASLAQSINHGRIRTDNQVWDDRRLDVAFSARARPDEFAYAEENCEDTEVSRKIQLAYLMATRRLCFLATTTPGGNDVLLDGGLRFRMARKLNAKTFPVRVVEWNDVLRFLLPPPRRTDRGPVVDKCFRFLKYSLDSGRTGVIGHNIPGAGQAAVVIGHIRQNTTKKTLDENLRRLRDHGIVNLFRVIHYESGLTPHRQLSDEAWFERIVWPAGHVGSLPNFHQIKTQYAAQAVSDVLHVKNLPAARKHFEAELKGCSAVEIATKLTIAKQQQVHLSVAFKVVKDGINAALDAYYAEENRRHVFNDAIPYLHRIGAPELEGADDNPHRLHSHFHQQYERLQRANMGMEDFKWLARETGVSLGEYLGREARERCLLDWFAVVSRAKDVDDLQIDRMAAHRFVMRRLLAVRGGDFHSGDWHELFQFVMTKFDIASLDRRCFWIATQRHLMV
jgi:hypothetical protein